MRLAGASGSHFAQPISSDLHHQHPEHHGHCRQGCLQPSHLLVVLPFLMCDYEVQHSTYLCWLLYHLGQKVFVSATQKPPELLFCSSRSYLWNFFCMRTLWLWCSFQPFVDIFIYLFFLKAACNGHPLQCPLYCQFQAAGQAPFSMGWQSVR